MSTDRIVADISELALSIVRAAMQRTDLDDDERKLYFDMLDVVHNVPKWLVSDVDAHAEMIRHVGYVGPRAQRWFAEQLRLFETSAG